IRLFGGFRLELAPHAMATRLGARTEDLLTVLALAGEGGISRDYLRDRLWPQTPHELAGQSLSSLVHALHRQLAFVLGGEAPVLYVARYYRLNLAAGIRVDVQEFDRLINSGMAAIRMGGRDEGARDLEAAVDLYRGDLPSDT